MNGDAAVPVNSIRRNKTSRTAGKSTFDLVEQPVQNLKDFARGDVEFAAAKLPASAVFTGCGGFLQGT